MRKAQCLPTQRRIERVEHPVGASGLRMDGKAYNQLLERAGKRQHATVRHTFANKFEGAPVTSVAAVAIPGRAD